MKWKKLYIPVLIILCFLVYLNCLNNAFISDDIPAITENPVISQPLRSWLNPAALLNSLCYLMVKDNPWLYHLVNIALHAINTVLVFIFLSLFFAAKASFLGAGLFAVHPVHAEAVAWISGKPYLVLTLAILGTYFLYDKSMAQEETARKLNPFLYILSILIFSYCLIENAGFYFLTPLFLILTDISSRKSPSEITLSDFRSGIGKYSTCARKGILSCTIKKWRRRWKLWLPFLIILAFRIILVKGTILQRHFYLTDAGGGRLALGNPMVKFTLVIFNHLKLMLWPLKLTFFHEPIKYDPVLIGLGMFCLTCLILAMPFIFKKSKEVFLGIAIFILFLFPVYSPIPLASNLVAERYVYFPSVALSIFAAFLYEKKKIALTIFLLLIFLCALRTVIRNLDWKTPESFWKSTTAVSYNSPSAYNALGLMYREKGEIKNAIASFGKAIELKPDYTFAYNNLGNLYSDINSKDEAISWYKKVVEINPRDLDAYYNLGITYSEVGKKDEAIASFKKAVEINPRDTQALTNLGIVYAAGGARNEAIACFKQAIKVDPDNRAAYFNLSLAYFYQKQYDLAIKYCDRAAELGHQVPDEFLKQLRPYRK